MSTSVPAFDRNGIKIFPLSEGAFTIDASRLFVPFDKASDLLTDRNKGSLLVEIQPFLVQTPNDLILLDAGLGFSNPNGQLQIHDNIRAAGFQPEAVTKVLMSHLHKDHAGGIARPDTKAYSGEELLNFPNAIYYVQRRELDFAWGKGFPSYLPDELEPLLRSPQVELLHEDEGTIDGYIRYQHTGGHSPHHQVFWIEAGGETVFFGGDDAPQLSQMRVRYKTRYDFDADKAMALRQQWWKEGVEKGWTFLFYHDTLTPMFLGKG